MAGGSGSVVARLRVEFLGDLKGYRESLKQAETEGTAASKKLGTALASSIKAPPGGWLKGLREDLELGRSKTLVLKDAVVALKQQLASLSVRGLHAGLNGIKTVLHGLKSAASDVFKGLLMGVGFAAFQDLTRNIERLVQVIPDLVKRGAEFTDIVRLMVSTTGASAESSSRLAATLVFLGEDASKVGLIITQLSKRIEDNIPLLENLGITVRDANGNILDAVTIMDNLRSSLSGVGNSMAKTQLILQTFGGRGALGRVVEYLQLTDAQMTILGQHFQETGQILTIEQVRIAEAAKREAGNLQGILNGLGSQILTVVAPQIIEFFTIVTQTISENADLIKQKVGEIINYLGGLVQGLTGLKIGAQSLTGSLGEVQSTATPTQIRIATLTTELEGMGEAETDTAGATRDASRAIQDQIEVVGKEEDALKKLADAQDKVYRKRLETIQATLDQRRATLDAAEAARDLAEQQYELNASMNEAQQALIEAQAGTAGKIDADAVAAAMQRVGEIRRQQEDLQHAEEVKTQRKSLDDTETYIDALVKLVEEGENRKALAKTLGKREKALSTQLSAAEAAGDTEGAANLRAKLEATQAAQQANAEKLRTDQQQAQLDRRKAMLQDELDAVRSTTAASGDIKRKALQDEIGRLMKLDEQETTAREKSKKRYAELVKDARWAIETVAGKGGSSKGEDAGLTGAFKSARDAGVKMGDDIMASLKGLIGTIGDVAGALGGIFKPIMDAWNALPEPLRGVVGGAIVGAAVGGIPGLFAGAIAGGYLQLQSQATGSAEQRTKLVEQAREFAKTGSDADLRKGIAVTQKALTEIEGKIDLANTPDGRNAIAALKQVLEILRGGIAPVRRGYAMGGLVQGPQTARLAEAGPEWIINSPALRALARLNTAPTAALAGVGDGGGSPMVFHSHLYLDGHQIAEVVDRWQADRRRI